MATVAIATKASLSVAVSLGTIFLSMGRKWLKDKIDDNVEKIASKNDLNESSAARQQALSCALTQSLDEIKEGIDILRNKDFESAKSYFMEALRWRNNKKKFQKYIEKSHHKCIVAQGAIVESYDKIFLYSLSITVGFIFHSNYGNNYIDGLKHVYNVLIDMNNDITLRKHLSAALKSKIYWTQGERKLIKSVIHFAVRTSALITEIQQSITKTHAQMITQLFSNEDELSTTLMYLNTCWLPRYCNGYYFGQVDPKSNPCKYSILSLQNFRKVMGAIESPFIITIDDVVIHTDADMNAPILNNWKLNSNYQQMQKRALQLKLNKQQLIQQFYDGAPCIHLVDDGAWYNCVNTTQIYVASLSGIIATLNVGLYETIWSVKTKIKDIWKIATTKQKLIFAGMTLENDFTLLDYNIQRGHTLVFVCKVSKTDQDLYTKGIKN